MSQRDEAASAMPCGDCPFTTKAAAPNDEGDGVESSHYNDRAPTSKNRNEDNGQEETGDLQQPRQEEQLLIRIVSACYGPCETQRGRGSSTTSNNTNDNNSDTIPYTRDVAPHVRALLIAQERQQHTRDNHHNHHDSDDHHVVRINALVGSGMKRANIPLLDSSCGRMNVLFGDPCPGVTKQLHLHYVITIASSCPRRKAASAQVHRVTFQEHEPVLLRRNLTFGAQDNDIEEQRLAQQQLAAPHKANPNQVNSSTTTTTSAIISSTSEIIVPLVLTFLPIKERVTCRLVCRLWRTIVRDWGVATRIDFDNLVTRPFLRGLISHSYSSLHTLRLAGMAHLERTDLHPSIPHLRKLKTLDVSQCTQLDDSTLMLLAQHVSCTLEVLYIKGLHRASDRGVVALCQSCTRLKVLEVSYVPITNASGDAMGRHLTQLRALYMRENYRLTHVDTITANCTKLQQLTLWGCLKVKQLTFENNNKNNNNTGQQEGPSKAMTSTTSRSLVSLNLWGCHSLRDDIAQTLGCMTNLRSLIVSECHRLTDAFAVGLAQHVPQLVHLHLRYCKRLTDEGVNVIANNMRYLHSLDLSFCSRVTTSSICNLLETRYDTLSELRLCNCHQLEIVRDPHQDTIGVPPGWRNLNNHGGGGRAGQSILISLKRPARTHGPGHASYLSLLDLQNCGGQPNSTTGYPDNDPFVRGMKSLDFQQKIPGFFVRPARWNAGVQEQLVNRLQEYIHLES